LRDRAGTEQRQRDHEGLLRSAGARQGNNAHESFCSERLRRCQRGSRPAFSTPNERCPPGSAF
jgi:hypothetical protein